MLLNFHSVDTNYTHTHTKTIQLKAKSIWIKSNKLISKLLNNVTQSVGIIHT